MKAITSKNIITRLLPGSWICVLFALLIVGCASEKTVDSQDCVLPGHFYEKWDSWDDFQPSRLKGNPKEIIDSTFHNLEDTIVSTKGLFSMYRILRFDGEGHQVFRRVFIDSGRVYDIYNQDCMNLRYVAHSISSKDTNHSQSFESNWVREKENVYRVNYTDTNSNLKTSSLVTFVPAENAVRTETSINDSLTSTETSFYKDGLLQRVKTVDGTDSVNEVYHYSSKGHLDSIVSDGSTINRRIFVNNEQGDVILYRHMQAADLLTEVRFQYEYDAKGNWIRRLAHRENNINSPGNTQKNPDYWLIKRYINY